ncbi:MAG TPA: hypothetical protein VEF03_09185, partial [Candidatus Binataceae bacterium]|nr:hypothetical protein [Candidatus Binataceae bacterium]
MITRREMMRTILAGSTAFAAASVFASAHSELAIAAESGGDKGVTVSPVFEHALADFPGHKAVVVKVDYAPGTASSAHHHAGSVFGYVLDGEIESANGS